MVFRQNHLLIEEHNELYRSGRYSFSMIMNKFGDITDDEYRATHLSKSKITDDSLTNECRGTIADNPNQLDSWDWTNRAVT